MVLGMELRPDYHSQSATNIQKCVKPFDSDEFLHGLAYIYVVCVDEMYVCLSLQNAQIGL